MGPKNIAQPAIWNGCGLSRTRIHINMSVDSITRARRSQCTPKQHALQKAWNVHAAEMANTRMTEIVIEDEFRTSVR